MAAVDQVNAQNANALLAMHSNIARRLANMAEQATRGRFQQRQADRDSSDNDRDQHAGRDQRQDSDDRASDDTRRDREDVQQRGKGHRKGLGRRHGRHHDNEDQAEKMRGGDVERRERRHDSDDQRDWHRVDSGRQHGNRAWDQDSDSVDARMYSVSNNARGPSDGREIGYGRGHHDHHHHGMSLFWWMVVLPFFIVGVVVTVKAAKRAFREHREAGGSLLPQWSRRAGYQRVKSDREELEQLIATDKHAS